MSRSMKKERAVVVTFVAALVGCGAPGDTQQPIAGEREFAMPLTDGTRHAISDEPDQVLAWNVTALRLWQGPQNPFFAFRWLPILHSSIFDAVNGVTGDYEPFIVDATTPDGSTANAAAAGAGYYIVTHLDYSPPLTDAQLQIIADHFNSLPTSITGNPGFAFGEDVAAQVLASRADDGAPTVPLTIYHAPCEGQPGCFVPQPTPTGRLLRSLRRGGISGPGS